MSNSELAVDGWDNCLFPSQFFKITMIIGESKDLHKEPLIIYFSVVKYRVVWLQWSITEVTLLQFIHENSDPALGKVQTLSSLHSHFSQSSEHTIKESYNAIQCNEYPFWMDQQVMVPTCFPLDY